MSTRLLVPALAVLAVLGSACGGSHGVRSFRFAAPSDYPVAPNPTNVAVADFDGDGTPDVATTSEDGSVLSVLLGRSDGTLAGVQRIPTPKGGSFVLAADLNGDGQVDLAEATHHGVVAVLLGHGDGTFGRPRSYPVGTDTWWVAAADLNADGSPDL
ncbi:MAG: VCBS repeat-containing protein, partial [Actinomycetota bacterium]